MLKEIDKDLANSAMEVMNSDVNKEVNHEMQDEVNILRKDVKEDTKG